MNTVFFFSLLLLLACAPRLSHASPSAVSLYLTIAVYLLLCGQAGSKEPLTARSGCLWLRGTGKSCSYGKLDRIAPISTCANRPTVRTKTSSFPPFTQDRSLGYLIGRSTRHRGFSLATAPVGTCKVLHPVRRPSLGIRLSLLIVGACILLLGVCLSIIGYNLLVSSSPFVARQERSCWRHS